MSGCPEKEESSHSAFLERAFDQTKAGPFVGKDVDRTSATSRHYLLPLGDRLGLFRTRRERPATSEALASRTGVDEPMRREWLGGMATEARQLRSRNSTFHATARTRARYGAGRDHSSWRRCTR